MGKEGDATPFAEVTVDNISAALHRCGYQSRGWETMYNGHTGRRLQAQIFLNPTYYQRLKHMVRCARMRGPCPCYQGTATECKSASGRVCMHLSCLPHLGALKAAVARMGIRHSTRWTLHR